MNISRPETEHKIAGVDHVSDVLMHPFQMWLVSDAAMAVSHYFIHDGATTNAGDWSFTRRINICHHDVVSIIERAAEFLAERLRPRVAVRLKHRQHAFAASRSGRF